MARSAASWPVGGVRPAISRTHSGVSRACACAMQQVLPSMLFGTQSVSAHDADLKQLSLHTGMCCRTRWCFMTPSRSPAYLSALQFNLELLCTWCCYALDTGLQHTYQVHTGFCCATQWSRITQHSMLQGCPPAARVPVQHRFNAPALLIAAFTSAAMSLQLMPSAAGSSSAGKCLRSPYCANT